MANRADVFDGQVRIANRLLDELGNLFAAVGALQGELAHFVGDDRKAFAVFAGPRRFLVHRVSLGHRAFADVTDGGTRFACCHRGDRP